MTTTYTAPKPGTIRWLSAAGHPGYSKASAARVLAYMVRMGYDPTDLRVVSSAAFQALYSR